ncbi:MAG: helix-turn-helix domain-containing protein [Rhizobiales bacterium]|nr:helix-turn-helix domain-containing protein [Hyphomicrobiales bacterium]
MSTDIKVTGRIAAAGRALAGIGPEDFARMAGMPADRLAWLEASGSARLPTEDDVEAILRAFERVGVVVIAEDGDMGAGVRLKFTRRDVRQIMRLEGEGGIVGSDDAP